MVGGSPRRHIPLPLVSDFADELVAAFAVVVGLYTSGRTSVDNSEDTSSLFGLNHDDLDRVGRGAKNCADLEAIANAVQQIDGISVANQYNKQVPRGDGLCILYRSTTQVFVVGFDANEAWT